MQNRSITIFFTFALSLIGTPGLAAFNFGAQEQESEFLHVNEAFKFSSETTNSGLLLHWDIAADYYLYQGKVTFESLDGNATFGEASFSQLGEEKTDPYFGVTRVVYDDLSIELPIRLINGASDAEVMISYQGCAEAGLCYPPEKRTLLYIPVAGEEAHSAPIEKTTPPVSDSATKSNSSTLDSGDANNIFGFMSEASMLSVVGIFFLLGIGLTFTPCVLPMIPIITTIVAGPNAQKSGLVRSFGLALSYVLGMALTYAALGLAMGMLGANANLQAAMQHPVVLSIFAAIFVLLALAMFGVYELQLPASLRDRLNNESQKIGGGKIVSVFLIGALSALLVSPCVSAPLAGALLYISASGDAALGFFALLSLGLGMGVPLILVAVGGAKLLPKAGTWMDATKFIFGMLLLAVAVWLIGRLVPGSVSLGLWALLALGSAVYAGAFEPAESSAGKLKKTIGLALFLLASVWFVGAFSGAGDPFKPLQNLTGQSTGIKTDQEQHFTFDTIYSLEELEAAKARAQAENKIAFVDVYADWCISCIVMEREVFIQDDVSALLNKFYLIKADVTDNTSNDITLLETFKLFGPPSYLFFDTSGQEMEEIRITGEISKQAFVERLQMALSSQS